MTYSPAHISAVPGAIDYTVNLFSVTCPTDSSNVPIMVWFGAELGVWQEPTTIELNAVHPISRKWVQLGPTFRIEEDFSIQCKITVFSGEGAGGTTDFLTAKDNVFSVWDTLEMAVANDPTLGGNVRISWFDDADYQPAVDAAGRAMGLMTWVIKCQARVTTLS